MARKHFYGKLVDWSNIPEGKPVLTSKELEERIKKYNIKTFKNKKEFIESNFITDKSLVEEGWARYKHIMALLKSGQYDMLRARDYQNTYITQYESFAGHDPELLKQLKELNIHQVQLISALKTNSKLEKASNLLPDISMFYQGTKDMDRINKDIKYALSLIANMSGVDDYGSLIKDRIEQKRLHRKVVKEEYKYRKSLVESLISNDLVEGRVISQGDKKSIDYYIANTINYGSLSEKDLKYIKLAYNRQSYKVALFTAINRNRNNGKTLQQATRFLPKQLVKVYVKWEKQRFNE